jgi:DNA-3-methyladenine glycosylase I
MIDLLRPGADGVIRCWWCQGDPLYESYHDMEWGRPVTDDQRLFEKICLEGFQAGLSWITILRKRENFRRAFAEFDFARVAQFDDTDIARLLADAGIVRHRGKIEATITNASRAGELCNEFGTLSDYFWQYKIADPPPFSLKRSTCDEAKAMSKDLKRRGWRFVGPTTAYAFMQAMGLVNDHVDGCELR